MLRDSVNKKKPKWCWSCKNYLLFVCGRKRSIIACWPSTGSSIMWAGSRATHVKASTTVGEGQLVRQRAHQFPLSELESVLWSSNTIKQYFIIFEHFCSHRQQRLYGRVVKYDLHFFFCVISHLSLCEKTQRYLKEIHQLLADLKQ